MNPDCSFAIIMPAYNCIETIDRAVSSVLKQTYDKWHLYIINDASKDDLSGVLQKYRNNSKITILTNDINLGAAETRNVGLRHSNEPYIAFLDSDDEWTSDKLMKQFEALSSDDDVVISEYIFIQDNDSKRSTIITYDKDYLNLDDFLKKKFRVCFSSVCFRRFDCLFKKLGHEDYLFLRDILTKYHKARVIKDATVKYYAVEGSLSGDKKKAAQWHLNCLRYLFKSRIKVSYYFLYYVMNSLLFKWKTR